MVGAWSNCVQALAFQWKRTGRATGVSRKARADLEGFKVAPQQRTQLEKALIDRDSDLIKIDQDTRDSMSSDRARCGDTGIK